MDVTAPAARRIVMLSSRVADAIAAGEVIERPASVVKELCENAVDAGATRIIVEVEGGGTTRIAVTDNGSGIASDDLPLAISRHATSKISAVHDLVAIATLGFRGEALASIAAVSSLTLTSTQAGARTGRRICVRAGEVTSDAPAASALGTTVDVTDLFFNTPARLRFLRSPRTESARAVSAVSDLALARRI